MFLNKIRNIFCVPHTKFVSAANVARAGKRGNICVGNNVSSFARAFSFVFSSLFYPHDGFVLVLNFGPPFVIVKMNNLTKLHASGHLEISFLKKI